MQSVPSVQALRRVVWGASTFAKFVFIAVLIVVAILFFWIVIGWAWDTPIWS
ncbi:MAG: hypothetical protein ABSB35_29015 [Bryobacteraceae bacterium]